MIDNLTPQDRRPYQIQLMVDLGPNLTLAEAIGRARELGSLINNAPGWDLFSAQWSTEDLYVINGNEQVEVHDAFTRPEVDAAELEL